jgi:hypothetical protein
VLGAQPLRLNYINLFMLMLRLAGVRFAPRAAFIDDHGSAPSLS